MLSTSCERKLQ